MKCIPIHRHGLWGTLVRIRRGLALQNTWIFKDTLGLFCLTSQREWSRPLSPDALSLTLTFATLLDYHTLRLSPLSAAVYFIFFCLPPHPFATIFTFYSAIIKPQICLLSLVSVVSEPLRQMKGWALVFSPAPLRPAQSAGCQRVEGIEMR